MSDSVKQPKDELLRRIGRNVVNYQRLEKCLQRLMSTLSISASPSMPSNLARSKQHKLKKMALGDLSSSFYSAISLEEQPLPESTSTTDISLEVSFRRQAPVEYFKENKKALTRVVQERNRLIHALLVDSDLNSIDHCTNLSNQLDEQNERIEAQIRYFDEIRQANSKLLIEIKKFFDSEEFLLLLDSGSCIETNNSGTGNMQ
jgi:hypothetical protein